VPTTWPGARLPHVWLEPGVSVHDRIGDGFTLLLLGGTAADAAGASRAFADARAPFSLLRIDSDAARQVYGYDLILVRPDLHVVWRGNRAPADPVELAAIATGHRRP